MKIIDLLNKIANGEDVPKYVKYYDRIDNKQKTVMVCKENIIYKLDQLEIELNDTVEILEEKKILEKLHHCYTDTDNEDVEFLIKCINDLVDKYNDLLDYLEKQSKAKVNQMNDEIKELMTNIIYNEDVNGFICTDERYKEIKNYITNLQQRIDKAVEYIYDFSLSDSIILKRSYKDLLKILKGDNND